MISRARFSLRPRLERAPARLSGPIDCALSRKASIAGWVSTASSMSSKRPNTMRPDRLALEGAGGNAHARSFRDGDREVVGPEHRQPLGKADHGLAHGAVEAGVDLGKENQLWPVVLFGSARADRGGILAAGHHRPPRHRPAGGVLRRCFFVLAFALEFALLQEFVQVDHQLRRRLQLRAGRHRQRTASDFLAQGAARIRADCSQAAVTGAEPEPGEGEGRVEIVGHRKALCCVSLSRATPRRVGIIPVTFLCGL